MKRERATSILIVSLCTALSRLLGFVRLAVIGTLYGGEGIADVIHLVFQIPNNLRRLLAEGALSSAFIPVLTSTLDNSKATQYSRTFIQAVFGFQLLLFIPLLLLSTRFSHHIIAVLFDFPSESLAMSANSLFKIFIWYLFPVSVGAIIMATLQIHGYFLLPALSPLLFSVAVISAILLLHSHIGMYAIAVGVIVGGVIPLLIQIPRVLKLRYSVVPTPHLRNQNLWTLLRFWAPLTIGSALFAINQQIASYFASGLAPGSPSAMINALTFWQLPFGILGISVLTVLYPAMSKAYSSGDIAKLQETLEYGLSYLIVIMTPAMLYLLILPHPVISVALQRGAFTAAHTALTARMLWAYSTGLLPVVLYYFLQRFYYSCQDYRRPVYSAGMVLVIDVGLSLWLKSTHLQVVGLAIANTIAFTCGLVYLLTQLPTHLSAPLPLRALTMRALKAWAALIIPAALLLVYRYSTWYMKDRVWQAVLLVLFTLLYIFVTLLGYKWFKVKPKIRIFKRS